MRYVAKRQVKRVVALANHRARIYVERCSVLLHQFQQVRLFTVQDRSRLPAQDSTLSLAKDKSGRTHGAGLISCAHFFLGSGCAPLRTRISTTHLPSILFTLAY